MSLPVAIIDELSDRVMHAQDHAHTLAKPTDAHPEMRIEDAYAVQDELRRRWITRGDRQVGMKAWLTSRAKLLQPGTHLPSFGVLMASMARPENGDIPVEGLLHPCVHAELGFVLKHDLEGPHCSIDQVIAATDYIIPSVEVIDSRYEGSNHDVISAIADNGSACCYVTGGRARAPQGVDLRTVGVVIEKNGEIMALGAGAAILNHPANAVVMLVKHLELRGEKLSAGSLIMTNGITDAVPVVKGDNIVARFQDMGSVSMRFI